MESNSTSLGILGANGAGKTTLIRILLGLCKPSSGYVNLSVDKWKIRVVPENPKLPTGISVLGWHLLLVDIYGQSYSDKKPFDLLNLNHDLLLDHLSAGQKKKASLMPLFYGEPKLFIIDEPTNYLDIKSRKEVLYLISEIVEAREINLIISSHRIDEIKLLCKDVILMKNGKIINSISNINDNVKFITISGMKKLILDKLKENKINNYKVSNYGRHEEFILDYSEETFALLSDMIKINAISSIQSKNSFDEEIEVIFN